MEHLRVISVQDVSGTSLLFLANNFREAELLVCGLKLLLERETARLGVRGGLPLRAFGGRYLEGAMSPSAARGFRDVSIITQPTSARIASRGFKSSVSDDTPSDALEENEGSVNDHQEQTDQEGSTYRKWGNVPGRNYMRGQAAATVESDDNGFNERGFPQYIHDHAIVREIVNNVRLPLSLPLCRVLLLDSASPVIKTWEKGRGDKHFDRTKWSFPSSSCRDFDHHSSDHQLITSGTMCGAYRTSSFDRQRYGSAIRLSETHSIEADDAKKVVFSVTERTPRRGFSVKVRIILRAQNETACDASVFAEIRPVGKDMSNQAAVHKAFLLVVDEIKYRYGEEQGLIAGFLKIADEMNVASPHVQKYEQRCSPPVSRVFRKTDPFLEEKKSDLSSVKPEPTPIQTRTSGLVSFEDMLKTGRKSPETTSTTSLERKSQHEMPEFNHSKEKGSFLPEVEDENYDAAINEMKNKRQPVTVEVKPLPKIRLSLMPSPREEDEEESSTNTPKPARSIRKKKLHSKRQGSHIMSSHGRSADQKAMV